MKKNIVIIFLAIVGIGLTLGDLSWVYAQEKEEFTLEEIIITAEKREENVQKTPLAVSIVNAEEINNKSLISVKDMIQNLAGVQIGGLSGGGGDTESLSIFIRGIGMNQLDSNWGDPAIALNVDGIQKQGNTAIAMSNIDVERVEVLRGPQGTLYGRSATGGAVNIIMVQPKDYFEATGKVQVGSYNTRNYEAVVNVPVYDKLALRISGTKTNRDGYLHYKSNPLESYQDMISTRMKAQFKPSEDLTITGTVEYNKDKSQMLMNTVRSENLKSDDPWYYTETVHTPDQMGTSIESWNYSLQLNWNIKDWTTFTFIPTMMNTKASGSSQQFPKSTQYTYEARFANAADSKLTWTLGSFLWDSKMKSQSTIDRASPELSAMQVSRPTNSWAIFGQATYPVTERFRVVGGSRYNYDNRSVDYRIIQTTEADDNGNFTVIYDSGIKKIENKESKPTFKFGLEYDVAKNSMAYIQASSGFKSGGLTFARNLDANGDLVNLEATKFKPETSLSYELGSKNRFLNNKLQVNGSLYFTRYNNAQVQMNYVVNEGTTSEETMTRVFNAGPSNMYGAELETTWMITISDRLTLGISSMHGKYNDLSITTVNRSTTSIHDLSGTQMANVPLFSLSLGYEHNWDLGDYGILAASFNTNYKTKYYNTAETWTNGALVPSYHMTDLYLNWTPLNGKLSANAYVKNLENKAIANVAMDQTNDDGSRGRVTLNNPRLYGLSITLKY